MKSLPLNLLGGGNFCCSNSFFYFHHCDLCLKVQKAGDSLPV